jgi:hypothetical protein
MQVALPLPLLKRRLELKMDSALDLINQGSLPPSIAGGAAPVTAPPVSQVGQNTKPIGMPAIPAKYANDPSVQVALKQQQEDDRVRKEQVDILKQKSAADETAGAEETAARKDLIAEGEKGPVKTPMPENMAKHLDPKELTDQYTAFMTLGALAGLLTRQPMTAALNNMTGAIEGIQKGDMDQYERNFKEWQTNYKTAADKNKASLEEHQRIMDNKKLSLDEKMAEHKLVDLKYGNQANIAVASRQDYGGYLKALDSSRTAQDKADEKAIQWGELNEKIHHDKAMEIQKQNSESASIMTDDAMNQAAFEKLYLGKEITGMGNQTLKVKERVRNLEANIIKQMNLSPIEAAMLPTNTKVKQKAIGSLEQWGAYVGKAQEQLDKTMDMAIGYAEQMSPSDIKRVNEAIISGGKEFGDPISAKYASAIQSVKTEYSRLMSGPTSNAMLPVEAQHRADDLISGGYNLEQLRGIKEVINKESKITHDAVTNQINSLQESITDVDGKVKDKNRTVVKTGTHNGKKVTQYSDGSIEYAN